MTQDRISWGRYAVKGAYYYRESYGYIRLGNTFRGGIDNSVKLVRQGDNRHDSKAIQVQTTDGNQIGWIAKELNRELALVMDNFDVEVVGVLTRETDFANHKLYMEVYVHKKEPKHERKASEVLEQLRARVAAKKNYENTIVASNLCSEIPEPTLVQKPVASDFL